MIGKRIAAAFAGITTGFAGLFAFTVDAHGAPKPAPRVVTVRHSSSVVTVDLRKLPHRDCWYEVYYVDRKATVEPICPS